jgi:hypothetical protein
MWIVEIAIWAFVAVAVLAVVAIVWLGDGPPRMER